MTRQINLYNPSLRLKREWLTARSLLYGIGVMVILLGLYGGVVRRENQKLTEEASRIGKELQIGQQELARLGEEIAQRKVSVETQEALQRAEAALHGRERVREALQSGVLGSSEGFAEFLRAFARQTQEGLWMVGLQMAEGGRNIMLEGRTINPDQIPGYIRALNGETVLRGRSFEALNVQLVGGEEGAARQPGGQGAGAAAARDEATKLPPYHEFQLVATRGGEAAGSAGAQQGEGVR